MEYPSPFSLVFFPWWKVSTTQRKKRIPIMKSKRLKKIIECWMNGEKVFPMQISQNKLMVRCVNQIYIEWQNLRFFKSSKCNRYISQLRWYPLRFYFARNLYICLASTKPFIDSQTHKMLFDLHLMVVAIYPPHTQNSKCDSKWNADKM